MAIWTGCIGALLVILLTVLQFTKMKWDQPHDRLPILSLAIVASLCLVTSSILQWIEKRKQADKDRKLPELIAIEISRYSSLSRVPVVEEQTESVDKLTPHEKLQKAQEAVFVDDALAISIADIKIKLAHDSEFRHSFEEVPRDKYAKFEKLRQSAVSEPIIAAKFIRAHLIPRSPWADMVRDIFKASGRTSYEAESDFLFEIFAVNVTNNPTTLQNIEAEAEIAGKWLPLKKLDDLSRYQLVFDPNNEADLPFHDDAKTEELTSFWSRAKDVVFSRGVGCQGWVGFGLVTDSPNLEKPIMHKVRLIDALGNIHPVMMPADHRTCTDWHLRHKPDIDN
jgi:hypothetical protein